MKIYLDIDGVMIDNDTCEGMAYLKEFLEKVFEISNGEVYWLSTHTHGGNNDIALRYLRDFVDDDVYAMLEKIKSTKWDTLKTEGIDINSDFLWFDDNIFNAEYKYLESIGKEHCLIKVKSNLEELVGLL